ncbi:MAG: efflux RND transporter periplasmic adaptor subunit [Clostridiaceae bacterium]|nr:efflux RND transporter periplasmic adaptor subunit [Clostridiaceae bacterium]
MLYNKGFGNKLVLSLVLLVLISSFSACNKEKQHINEEIYRIPVMVKPVQIGSLENTTEYTGILKPKKIVYVASPIPGRVTKANYEVGDRVKKGSILFSIDSKEIEANIMLLEEQLKIAEINIALAEAKLASAMRSGYESRKLQLKSALTSAEHNFEAAKKAFDTATVLHEKKAIDSIKYYEIKNQFEQAKNALKTADSSYQLYIDQLSEEEKNLSNQQLKQARASFNAINIQLETAKQQLENTNIKSPIDGMVVSKDIFEGALISNTMTPYIISDTDTLQAVIPVTEQVVNKIQEGSELKIEIPAVGKSTFTGKIVSVSPVIDAETFSYNVLIDIPNKNNLIKPGMTVKVNITAEKKENIIIVPVNSILTEDNGKYVFTIENDKAVKRFVDTGISNNDMVEITKGLEKDQLLVVKGHHFLNHNDPVIVLQEDTK